jgi:hypothetical protein
MREGRVVLKASTFEHIKVEGEDGYRKVPKWGKTVSFDALQIEDGLRFKNKSWRGKQEVEGEMAALLMSHPRYGHDFIAFTEGGKDPELIDSFFETNSDGSVTCWLTKRDFINEQGAAGHRTSQQFKDATEQYLQKARTLFARR